MIRMSRKPRVVRSATPFPLRSMTTLEPSVVPWTAWARSAQPSPARATSSRSPSTQARAGSCGVVRRLPVSRRPSSACSAKSVKVPPTSKPTRKDLPTEGGVPTMGSPGRLGPSALGTSGPSGGSPPGPPPPGGRTSTTLLGPRVGVLAGRDLGRPERDVLPVQDLGREGVQRPLAGGRIEAEAAADRLDVEALQHGEELLPVEAPGLLQPGH